jgi:hypothetical protein
MRRGAGASTRAGAETSASAVGAADLAAASNGPAPCAAAATTGPGTAAGAAIDTVWVAVAVGLAATAPAGAVGFPSVAGATPGPAAAAIGGLTTTGPDGAFDAIAGVCGGAGRGGATTMLGACRTCGTIFLGAGFASLAAGAAGGPAAGAVLAAGFAAAAVMVAVGSGAALVVAAAGVAAGVPALGGAGWVSCCFFSRIALATSPTLWTFDQSIFGLASASCRAADALPLPPRAFRMCVRTRSASSVSIELECVFFSVTPTAVSASRISLLLTSSSRANSLIRTVLIRPRVVSTSHRSLVLHKVLHKDNS